VDVKRSGRRRPSSVRQLRRPGGPAGTALTCPSTRTRCGSSHDAPSCLAAGIGGRTDRDRARVLPVSICPSAPTVRSSCAEAKAP
jgi:hypothetical protein